MRDMRKVIEADIPKHVADAYRKELENDGILSNKYCKVWFDLDKKTIYGEELVGQKRKLQTSGKNNILKSWHDVVIAFYAETKIDDVKKITSQYGYTILE